MSAGRIPEPGKRMWLFRRGLAVRVVQYEGAEPAIGGLLFALGEGESIEQVMQEQKPWVCVGALEGEPRAALWWRLRLALQRPGKGV